MHFLLIVVGASVSLIQCLCSACFHFLNPACLFFFQVRAALLECQQVILWGSVLLLSSAATLPHLTQRYLRPDCHRSLHGAVLPRRHVPHVHERHLGGLSKTGENFDWQVSDGLREGILYIKRWMSSETSNTFSSRFPSVFSVRFKCHRAALNVVIYPLQHEDLPTVIRQIPLTLLDRITLFQSHVAQPPHLSPMWHQQKASVWLVLNSWGDQTVFCRKYDSQTLSLICTSVFYDSVIHTSSAVSGCSTTKHHDCLHLHDGVMTAFKGKFTSWSLLFQDISRLGRRSWLLGQESFLLLHHCASFKTSAKIYI